MNPKNSQWRRAGLFAIAVGTAAALSACGGDSGGSSGGFGGGGNSGDGSGGDTTANQTWEGGFTPTDLIDTSAPTAYISADVGVFPNDEKVITVGNVGYDDDQEGDVELVNNDALVTAYDRQGGEPDASVFSGEGTLTTYADNEESESEVDRGFNHTKAAAATPAGGAVAVGTSNDPDAAVTENTNSWFAIKYDSDGRQSWQRMWRRCNTLVSCDAQPFAVAVDENGNIFVSGFGSNTSGTQGFQIEALNPSGKTLWTDRRDSSVTSTGYDLLVRPESGSQYLYATEPKQNYIHKYQVADGAHLWDQKFDQKIVRIATAPDGENLIVVSANGRYVAKVDANNGGIIWEKTVANPTRFRAIDVTEQHIYVAADQDHNGKDDIAIYDLKVTDDENSPVKVNWRTVYDAEYLIPVDLDSDALESGLIETESNSQDTPVGIHAAGDNIYLVLNSAIDPDQDFIKGRNQLTYLVLDPTTGDAQNNTVQGLDLNIVPGKRGVQAKAVTFADNGMFVTGRTAQVGDSGRNAQQYTARVSYDCIQDIYRWAECTSPSAEDQASR